MQEDLYCWSPGLQHLESVTLPQKRPISYSRGDYCTVGVGPILSSDNCVSCMAWIHSFSPFTTTVLSLDFAVTVCGFMMVTTTHAEACSGLMTIGRPLDG
eukprot:GHUV01038414.1.p1 GENE.GHUV01038414.1~~GHUV01038414.1.p1  ORF type:complete len:100 (-),score=2.68 GHUV01038414.1:189-488(-)